MERVRTSQAIDIRDGALGATAIVYTLHTDKQKTLQLGESMLRTMIYREN